MDNTDEGPSIGAASRNQQIPHQHSPEQSGSESNGTGAAHQGGAEEDESGTKENVVVKVQIGPTFHALHMTLVHYM
jgi:hypothetical protein